MNSHEDDGQDDVVSKSQIKREMLALQDLGRELLEADRKLLEKCALPDKVTAAIEEYRRLPNAHGARKRQIQYIGKLMRDIDISAIEDALHKSKQNAAIENRRFQQLEVLRDQLLAGNEDSLNQLILDYPDLEIQHLRQLIRQSQKEQLAGKPLASSRKLFRYLRELTSNKD